MKDNDKKFIFIYDRCNRCKFIICKLYMIFDEREIFYKIVLQKDDFRKKK